MEWMMYLKRPINLQFVCLHVCKQVKLKAVGIGLVLPDRVPGRWGVT